MKTVSGRLIPSTIAELLVPKRSALLVIDVQNDFIHEQGHFARHGRDVVGMQSMLPTLYELIACARRHNVAVCFIQQSTLQDGRSDSDAWLYFKTRDGKSPDYTLNGTWGEEFYGALSPEPGDVQIRKFRPSAFHGTELSRLLRVRGIQSVVTCGVVTQGCVLATTLDASFNDFYALVAADATASTSRDFHVSALRFLESRYDCPSVDEINVAWEAASR